MSLLKVDLHLHSGEDPVDRINYDAIALIDRAAELEFDALAITLHDGLLESDRVQEYARERDIVLLPGIERTIRGKHVLLLNFPNDVQHVHTFDDIAALKARTNGLVIAPHAFFPDRTCLRSALDERPDLFDAVEWSYFWTRGLNFNRPAARWADAHGKPMVGNSDLHDLRQLGRTYSWVTSDPDADAICDAIRQGSVTFQTTPVPPAELIRVFGGMLMRPKKTVSGSASRSQLPASSSQLSAAGFQSEIGS
jgi:predicted metal-dependent phosphoesterase TrpH